VETDNVATAFSEALNFSIAHLARKWRHEVALEDFGEHIVDSVEEKVKKNWHNFFTAAPMHG